MSSKVALWLAGAFRFAPVEIPPVAVVSSCGPMFVFPIGAP
ncbi:hypothetical protein B0E53_04787 [Micromonospora sp. MH33]|nr:hypothetical protein B0E53_04787 [Micromonospora sp. MH33]